MFRSSNPALNDRVFRQLSQTRTQSTAMTIGGVANKTLLLIVLASLPAFWMWGKWSGVHPAEAVAAVQPFMLGGMLGGFALALVTIFKREWAMVTAPLYALVEGFFLGAISITFDARFPGIVLPAVSLTFGVTFVMLGLYRSRAIRVTNKLRMGVFAATGAIALMYILSMVLSFFGIQVPLIHSGGPLGIAFSLFVVGVAAFNLLMDFDAIERGAADGIPQVYEWFFAFGIIVTLVWMYLEMLRLLSKLRN